MPVYAPKKRVDGVELHAAQLYVVGFVLSPLRNHRTDALHLSSVPHEGFLLKILVDIRAKCGADFPIVLLLSGFEPIAMVEINDTQRMAPILVAAGVECVSRQLA